MRAQLPDGPAMMTPADSTCKPEGTSTAQMGTDRAVDSPFEDRTLLDLCLWLRMAHNGSADPISDEETHEALAYLRRRLIHWKPSHPSGKRFDECVRQLVIAAHDEVINGSRKEPLFRLRWDGVGAPLVAMDGGTVCLGCKSGWPGDLSRVGMRCGNLLCPDRKIVGAR